MHMHKDIYIHLPTNQPASQLPTINDVLNIPKNRLQGKIADCSCFAYFCGINTPNMANFK